MKKVVVGKGKVLLFLRRFRGVTLVGFAIALVSLSGCEEMLGTGTGNPIQCEGGTCHAQSDGPNNIIEDNNGLVPMAKSICEKLVYCNSEVDLLECGASVESQSQFNEALGFEPETFADLQAIYDALYEGELQYIPRVHSACIKQIETLQCFHEKVLQAYDKNAEDPFANASVMLSPVCEQFIIDSE